MQPQTLALIKEHASSCDTLAQASDHIDQKRYAEAEVLLVGVLEEAQGETIITAHYSILLAHAREYQGQERSSQHLYHNAVSIYDRALGSEHPVVQELAMHLMTHFYY